MDHRDHVALLRPAQPDPGGTWADLGAGSGAFTLALRELVGASAEIHAVDRDRAALRELERAHARRFDASGRLHLHSADLARPPALPLLDGVVMANSLHYFRDREQMLRRVRELLRPDGMLLLVEYNVDSGNPWVPHPLSFETFRSLAPRAGFGEARLIGRVPSRFLREIYSAVARRRGD
jgi:ubiquinone/menaquinone biosynthesis C-methylase UbiE